MRHGTRSAYTNKKCRCFACRAANAEYQTAATERRKSRECPEAKHGTYGGYTNYGCRCDRCKEAAASWNSGYYQQNKETIITSKNARRQAIMAKIQALKTAPCTDCGHTYPYYVMDFDHVPERGPKLYSIHRLTKGGFSDETIDTELAKCELVCANCHRERAHRRSN